MFIWESDLKVEIFVGMFFRARKEFKSIFVGTGFRE